MANEELWIKDWREENKKSYPVKLKEAFRVILIAE